MQWTETLEMVQETIQKNALLPPKARVLVAISGGPDSIFLAYCLHQLGYQIGLAHVNYKLRGEDSNQEEQLVRSYGEKWNVPVFVQVCDTKAHAEVHQLSVQVAARKLRYSFFERLLEEEPFDYCATGHHANDQVESILMSFFRGNKPQILHGIPRKRGPYVRPLIDLDKTQILQSLEELALSFGMDYTNEENTYLRNQFRNQLIPVLHQVNPSISSQLLNRYEWYQQQQQLLTRLLSSELSTCITEEQEGQRLIWTSFIQKWGKSFLPQLIIAAGQHWGWHGQILWRMLELMESQAGKLIEGPASIVTRVQEGLFFHPKPQELPPQRLHFSALPLPPSIEWAGRTLHFAFPAQAPYSFGKNLFFVDLEKIQFPLQIREWQEGDKMQPYGMKGMKKLSDIFIDAKFSPLQKEKAIVIEAGNQIIALSDFRIAEPVKITDRSQKVLQIVIEG